MNARLGTVGNGHTRGMGMLGFLLVGTALGALASPLRPRGDRLWVPFVGGLAALFGGVLSATARHGDLVPFFDPRAWTVACAVAVIGVVCHVALARRLD